MKNENPLISVVIPVYNRAHLIEKTINSVSEQSYKNLEIIIVDDCSTDNIEELIKKLNNLQIRFFKQKMNMGPSAARNRGVEEAKGELIAFLDSDDEWYPDKIEKQVKQLVELDGNTVLVYSGFEMIDFTTGGKIGEKLSTVDLCKNFISGTFLLTPQPSTTLVRKSAFKEVGGFDINLKANEDTELAIKLCKKYKLIPTNEILVKVTRNHNQLMGNLKNYIEAREIILQKHSNYLSKKILFNLSKQIANYYILNNNYSFAKKYIIQSLYYNPSDFKTKIQKVFILFAPFILKILYSLKYKSIPNISGLKR